MITYAREQGIIDFKIECKGAWFGNFEDRDSFLESYKKDPQFEFQEEVLKFEEKTVGDMKFDKQEKKIKRIQEQLKAQEEQMKLREDKLRMREQELNEKVNEIRLMEEHLDMKVDEIRLGEENLRRQLGDMMEMMKLVLGNTTAVGSENLDAQETSPVQDNTIDSATNELTTANPEDDELQKMVEEFQRELAEQNRSYEEKLRIAQEKRREMNERAEEDRRRISGNSTRAAPSRHSFPF